jgi:hypothetical protein
MSSGKMGPRQLLGAALLDVPRLLPRLLTSSGWVGFGNRRDDLRDAPSGRGVFCVDRWSSELHVCRAFPALGSLLMRRALREWPISMSPSLPSERTPEITFVVPFRGAARLPALRATLASLHAQREMAVECIVVEQDARAYAVDLPAGVRHVHLPDGGEWRKSRALNVGVSRARAPIVICHDADILVPDAYARQAREVIESGFEVAQLGRLLFYLDATVSADVIAAGSLQGRQRPLSAKQNWPGGSIVICRSTYLDLGGFDESFTGWGGEDNEFFDRCLSRPFWRYGYLPFVHLWHADQGEKIDVQAREQARTRLEQALCRDRLERIETLRSRQAQILS